MPVSRLRATVASAASSGPLTGVSAICISLRIVEIFGMVPIRAEGVDMIEVSVRMRDGWQIAMVWAIMPPSEMPAMWARSQPSVSSTATASSAMSSSR